MFKPVLIPITIMAGLAGAPAHAIGAGFPITVPSLWPEEGAFDCRTKNAARLSTRGGDVEVPTTKIEDGVRGR